MEWISVKDRLPEIDMNQPEYSRGIRCLVCTRYGYVCEAEFNANWYSKKQSCLTPKWYRHGKIMATVDQGYITHYQPLPSPPK